MTDHDTIQALTQALLERIEWEKEMGAAGYEKSAVETPPLMAAPSAVRPVQPSPHPATQATPSASSAPAASNSNPPSTAQKVQSPGVGPLKTTSPPPSPAPLEKTKAHALSELKFTLEGCTACPLHTHRSRVVFSDGTMNADIVFVGDAPSQEEDLVSLPFIGNRGHLLNKIILAMGLRRETSYLCNVLKCPPPTGTKAPEASILACTKHLHAQLLLVQPKVIVTLGAIPTHALLQTSGSIEELRGRFIDWKGIHVMPTYSLDHMLKDPASKRAVWEDMKQVKGFLT